MIKNLKPDKYYKNIYDIDYRKLKKKGIKYLLFDLDNTIGDNRCHHPEEKAINLFKELKELNMTPILISNALPWRVKAYANDLDCDAYWLSAKPRKKNYLKIINKYNPKQEEVACIGDQIYTDIKGAKRFGYTSILVDRISKYESYFSIPNRIREKINIYNKKVITKGDYYE